MIKKTPPRMDSSDSVPPRLRLRRATLRLLTSTELKLVNGGFETDPGEGGGHTRDNDGAIC